MAAYDQVIVIASADAMLRQGLNMQLRDMHWHVLEAKGGAEAIAHLEEQTVKALVCDMWLPDLEVGAFLGMVQELYPKLYVLSLDGMLEQSSLPNGRSDELKHMVRAFQAQATSQQERATSQGPVCSDEIYVSAMKVREQERQSHKVVKQDRDVPLPAHQAGDTSLSRSGLPGTTIPGMVGQSAAMRDLVNLIHLVAPHSARVLIEGETGTGKELVAKAIHALSSREKKAFVVLNCAAIPEALLEAELFGHTRGAFTGAVSSRIGRIEAAHGGTLFLDEIGEMPTALQAKLLRFLENGELQRVGDNASVRVDVRVISATHQDLDKRVTEGTFRLDLLHRLAVFPVQVPSLRDRLDDLPLLAEYFLSELAKEMPRKRLTPDALTSLYQHGWPGNIRELGHVIQRAAILAGSRTEITPAEIRVRLSRRS